MCVWVGYGLKRYANVIRFQATLHDMEHVPARTAATLASDNGYFDQAHFVKDFRRMTGGVPRGYRGYYPPEGPADFAPNVVVFLQDPKGRTG